jgi:hypothetical protein
VHIRRIPCISRTENDYDEDDDVEIDLFEAAKFKLWLQLRG